MNMNQGTQTVTMVHPFKTLHLVHPTAHKLSIQPA